MSTKLSIQSQSLKSMTLSDLETLIRHVVQQVLSENKDTPRKTISDSGLLPPEFLATFGAWQDSRSDDEIISDIYQNRTIPASS